MCMSDWKQCSSVVVLVLSNQNRDGCLYDGIDAEI